MPREINNFRQFNEANIRSNKGLDRDYIDNIKRSEEREAHRKLQRGEVDPRNMMQMASELISLQGGRAEFTRMGIVPTWIDREKKAEVEELARSIIDDRYGRIINALNIDMDIKLVDPQELRDMKQGEKMSNSPQMEENWEEEVTDDEDFIADVQKRKIANIITQGSAKNVHRLIHMYRDRIEELDPRMFEVMDLLIKSNEVQEWLQPEDTERGGQLIRQFMNGYTMTEFPENRDQDEMEEEIEERTEDIDIEALLNNDENEEAKLEEAFDGWDDKIKVKARAIDLVVLLHESVKGIFEVLGSPSIPEDDEDRARDIIANTDTLEDEFEDLRYGPQIREDLLEWVNSNDKVNDIDDGFEYVWGAMVSVESKLFLELFKDAIIDKTGKADRWLDQTLDRLKREEKEFKDAQSDYEQQMRDWEEQQKFDNIQKRQIEKPKPQEESGEPNYSEMSKKQLGELRDQALDDGNFELLKKITKYL